VQSASVGNTRGGDPVFPPTAAAIQRTAWLFWSNAWPRPTSHVDMALFVFLAQGLARPAGPFSITRGWRSVCWPIRDRQPPLFLGGARLLASALPDHRCKIETEQHPMTRPLQGVGTPKLARATKNATTNSAVIDGKTVTTRLVQLSPAAATQR